MKLRHIFLKYCFKFFTAFLLVLSCCLVLAFVSYRSIEGYVIKENEFRLKEGIDDIKENMSKMVLIPQMIKNTNSFVTLTQLSETAAAENYIDLKNVNQEYSDISLLYTFSDYIFTVFRNNDAFLSTGQCSAEFTSHFNNLFNVSEEGVTDGQGFKQQLFNKLEAGELFWRIDAIEYYSQGKKQTINDAILCLVKDTTHFSPSPSHVTVFVLNPTDLIQGILTQESFRGNTAVSVRNTQTDEILLSNDSYSNADKQKTKYQQLNYTIPEINWSIDLAFPKEIINKQCAQIRSVLYIYIAAGLLIVLAMTLFMSYKQYSKIKQLFVHLPLKNQNIPKGQDEYKAINSLLSSITDNNEQYENEICALTQQNQAIMLESLIVHGINSQEERDQFEKYLPPIMDFFCIVLVEMESDELRQSNQAVLFLIEYIKKSYPHPFVNVHTSIKDELFLLSFSLEDSPDVKNVQTLFEKAIAALVEKTGIAFKVGISTLGSDLVNINKCYNQAKQVVQANRWDDQSFVRSYQNEAGEIQENIIGMDFLDKLYNLLLSAEREAVLSLFTKTFNQLKSVPFFYEKHKQEIYYSVSNTIRSAYSILAIELPELSGVAAYDSSCSADEMKAVFLSELERFCDNVNENKKSRNNELNERIVDYINQNFINPSLNAGLVCSELGISEKYLIRFIKELTGESFSCYLEHIRVDAALHYLATTDMSNEKIARATGFAAINTFYRVFGKRMGISPGTYRGNLNHE